MDAAATSATKVFLIDVVSCRGDGRAAFSPITRARWNIIPASPGRKSLYAFCRKIDGKSVESPEKSRFSGLSTASKCAVQGSSVADPHATDDPAIAIPNAFAA